MKFEYLKIILVFILFCLNETVIGQDSTYKIFSYPRKDKLCIKLHAEVKTSGDHLNYKYRIESLECSEQDIETFRLECNAEIDSLKAPDFWYSYYNDSLKLRYNVINFHAIDSMSFIKPMHNLSGFNVSSSGLPTISKYFISGYVPWQMYAFSDEDWPDSVVYSNIFDLSYKGSTISPANIQSSIDALNLIDTLILFNDSSYTLGWIKSQETKDKYNTYFNNAKNYLILGDSSATRNELQKVLNDCIIDSSSVLTSEAYALLYFNTDYLIKQIHEGTPGLPVKLEDSQGNLLQDGSLQ